MMKSKKGLSESLLMTLLIGGNVIWGGHSGTCRRTAEICFR